MLRKALFLCVFSCAAAAFATDAPETDVTPVEATTPAPEVTEEPQQLAGCPCHGGEGKGKGKGNVLACDDENCNPNEIIPQEEVLATGSATSEEATGDFTGTFTGELILIEETGTHTEV
ncbi:MAG: hypothetical protein WCG42_03640 [Parachlamydiaceae bacterium]